MRGRPIAYSGDRRTRPMKDRVRESVFNLLGPAVVVCSPPFSFYTERKDDMLALVGTLVDRAPAESLFALEADETFDMSALPRAAEWDVRIYPPAVIGILRT